ncbi:MAG: heme-binding protein, partial [Pseudomonadota bacterium]
NYIFGGNQAKNKIEMTAPVTQAAASQKIDMTAPVTQAPGATGNQWTIAFVMPDEWTMETLPTPNDPSVVLREVPGRLVATVRFNGRARPDAQAAKTEDLEAWIAANGYEATGPAEVAFYNAPYVPGPLRRNEIMIPVRAVD